MCSIPLSPVPATSFVTPTHIAASTNRVAVPGSGHSDGLERVESGPHRCQRFEMRQALFIVSLTLLASCSEPSPDPDPASPSARNAVSFDVAYQVTEGVFQGMYLFVDPRSGETWPEYRDEREAVAKGGFGDPLTPCSRGSIRCYQTRGGQPLLSSLPPPDFLNGEFRYATRPRTYWSWPCTEISATSKRGATTSVVCPVVGLVEFSVAATNDSRQVQRFQLRSFNGLFAQR
jgi:hypothetical protein